MVGQPRRAPNSLAGHRGTPAGQVTVIRPPRNDGHTGCKLKPAEPCLHPAHYPPSGMLKASRSTWDRFWASELSDYIEWGAELPRVLRWIRLVDELERAWRTYRSQRFLTGSTGQPVLNKIWKVITDCETRIERAEEELGMTPKARARLGIILGRYQTIADLNSGMDEPDEPRGPRDVTAEVRNPTDRGWTQL